MPTLALIATGGTIAGSGPQHHYTAGVLDASVLLAAVPELAALAAWQVEQPFSIDSRDMQPAHWLDLAARIRQLQVDPSVDGIVITHGTDTLEETAFALHLLVETTKPVVLTAAMRPASARSADGPLNLLHAACTALDPLAALHGVLVTADASVIHAADLLKAHTHKTDALRCIEGRGLAGQIMADTVRWQTAAPQRLGLPELLALSAGVQLPRVDVLSAHAGASADLIDFCVTAGARGLVLALTGHGSIPADWRTALDRARSAGVQVVRASRISAGGVWPGCNEDDEACGCIAAGPHTPQQARVLLMLALAALPDITRSRLAGLFSPD
ncbi:asparaginase [Uliginosibacterium paludis]|uniref:Asparaginase n=1 Tax=Uliginosibacterium paludis TaxID=1615952 RepID=A0ABV2CQL6_9RHOO